MEVFSNTDHYSLILGNPLDLVAPFPRKLDGGLNCFSACVHWQNHIETEELGDELRKAWEDIVVKCPRTECQSLRLIYQSLDKFRMAMSLINS